MNRGNRALRYRPAGFTLVEVLVALTLFSLILSTLFSSLYAAGRNWEGSELRVEQNDDARLGLTLVRRLIEELVPLQLVEKKGTRLLFNARSDSVRFAAPLPAHAGGGGIYWVRLYVDEIEEGKSALLLSYQPVHGGLDWTGTLQSDATDSIMLMDGVTGLSLEYYGSMEPESQPVWHSDWTDDKHLPEAIRANFTLHDQQRSVPELVIPLHLKAMGGQSQLMVYANASSE